jgi:hypothetical protein
MMLKVLDGRKHADDRFGRHANSPHGPGGYCVYHSVITRLEIARAQCPGMPELAHMIECEPFVDAMCDSSFMLPAAKLFRSYHVLFWGSGVHRFCSEHHA